MFKHGGQYYIVCTKYCCACHGGSNGYVFSSDSPLGTWRYVTDINRNASADQSDIHSPLRFTTRAQTATVLRVPQPSTIHGVPSEDAVLMLSNQWLSAPPPSHARNADRLYWNVVRFNATTGDPLPIVRQDTVTLAVSPPQQ